MSELKMQKYWFSEDGLVAPIDWHYLDSLPLKVRLGVDLYMEGRVSLGKAAEIAGLTLREFDEVRAKGKVPIRGPND
jgi:hypothetical protein